MQLVLYNQPQGIPINKNRTQKEYVLYSDSNLLISLEPSEQKKVHFYQTDGKICIIFGGISIGAYNGTSSDNLASVYLEKYVGKPEEFLLISNGNFLVIEYDRHTRSLTALRDLIGLKHAYYSVTSEGICLSSSIIPVLKFRGKGNNDISAESLDLYLTFQYLPQPYTLFENIFQLPLNKRLSYKDNEIKFINNKYSYIEMLNRHKKEYTTDLQDILSESFKRQIGDTKTKIGAFLSGGMDTSSNIAILASDLGIRPTVFTAAFKEIDYDETPYARIMAEKYQLEHNILTITSDAMKELPTISALFDNPIADRAIIPEYIICQKAKEMGITHMVTGEGGDEVLGYPRNLPEDIHFEKRLFKNEALAEFYYSLSGLIQKDLRRKLLIKFNNSNYHDYLCELYQEMDSFHPFEKIYYGQWQTWMIDNVLIKDTQLFQNLSLQFISPYMDLDLMKHCMSLTVVQKMEFLRNKNYLKNGLKKILPHEIIHKSKHKFHVPISEWLRYELYEQAHDTLLDTGGAIDKFIDKKIIIRMLEDHKRGKIDYNRPLWGLLFLENWYKMKKDYI